MLFSALCTKNIKMYCKIHLNNITSITNRYSTVFCIKDDLTV